MSELGKSRDTLWKKLKNTKHISNYLLRLVNNMTIEQVKIDGVVYDVVMQHFRNGCKGCHFLEPDTCQFRGNEPENMLCTQIEVHNNANNGFALLDEPVAIFKKAE